jgi:hypothetical protein
MERRSVKTVYMGSLFGRFPTPMVACTSSLESSPGTGGCVEAQNRWVDTSTVVLGNSSWIPFPPRMSAPGLAQRFELRLIHHCTMMAFSTL